ncbi:succinyl-diaminopimelate desuccinylase [Pseudoclavibacter helvolus]|uniref:succinyl-diaminopimelate desuccinylase n=1 Tax=Pseudoclavibacter helvolus TaxID=255205 RepID=UPI003C7930B4
MSSFASAGAIDLTLPSTELTRLLCDIPSESGDEATIADAIEAALAPYGHLEVQRLGNTIIARTSLGRAQRVAIAGHIDTVPINKNLPTKLERLSPEQAAADVPGTSPGEYLWGRGTVDMKAGVAVQLRLAAELVAPAVDVTWIWYDNEEVASDLNGLGLLAEARPELLAADFAILGEPTKGEVEGGCNGTIRVDIRTRGRRAHSARAWVGDNAIHKAAPILARLAAFEPSTVPVEGLEYREGLNAVRIYGGVAGNVIPDECVVHVNYRFAPDKTLDEAEAQLRSWFGEFELDFVDRSPAARPGLDAPLARGFLEAVGAEAKPKYGWTDVARFSALGIPAVNYGPGDPLKAHADDERVLLAEITRVEEGLRSWLTSR